MVWKSRWTGVWFLRKVADQPNRVRMQGNQILISAYDEILNRRFSYNCLTIRELPVRPRIFPQTTTTTQYDSVGRVVSVNYSDGTANRLFDYDNNCCWPQTPTNIKGRLSLTGGGSGATVNASVMSYDAMGRVINMWACGPATCDTGYQSSRPLSFVYDWAGNLTQESDLPSGTISYGRSIAGEVTSITNESYQNLPYDPPNLVSNVVNGPDGPVSYTLGNGLNVYRSYDSLGRPYGQWVCNGPAASGCSGGTQIYGTTSTWKGVQMQEQNDTVLNQQVTLGYDGLNRLTSRTVTAGTVQNYTYAYDRYGNRSQTALQTGFNFNPTYSATTNHITSSGYTYDAAGNMTNDAFHSYKYDAEGNIVQVDTGSAATTYAYDVFNHRIHVQTPSATTEFIYDYAGRRVSSWLSPNNFGDEGRIYWDGQQIAYRANDGTTYFDHQDILGTERMRTNYAGSVGSSYVSLPWGDGYTATVNSSGADQDNAHFADLERDAESGTEHAQFRNYTSRQGRWLSPDQYTGSYDPTNPQSMNRYAYVLNNPMSLVDPLGLGGPCDPQESETPCPAPPPCDPNSAQGCGQPAPECTYSFNAQGQYEGEFCSPTPTSSGSGNPGNSGNTGNGGSASSKPSLLHIAACAIAAPVIGAAQASNRTVGVGLGGSAGAGFILGLFASVGVQIVADPQGNAGLAVNVNTSASGGGIGAQGGGQFSLSTARNINELSGGPSVDLGGSSGIFGLDASHTPGGPTTGTVTIGPGVGGKGAALTAGYTGIPLSTNCSDLIN
jgi:RHS repeat-associated protein